MRLWNLGKPLGVLYSRTRPWRTLSSSATATDGFYILLPAVPSDTAETNALLRSSKLPEFAGLSEEQIQNGLQKLTIDYESSFYRVEEELQKTKNGKSFNGIIGALDRLNHGLIHAYTTAQILSLVQNSPKIKAAVENSLPAVARCKALSTTNLTVLNALRDIERNQKNLSEAQRRVIAKYLLEAKLNGVELTGKDLRLYHAVVTALKDRQEKYRANMVDSVRSFNAPPVDPMMMDELPFEIADQVYLTKDGKPRSPYFSLNNPMYDVYMEYCSDRDGRKTAFTCRNTRAGFQNPTTNNSLVIEDIRQARMKEAQILGYENYASLSMETKMAKSVDNVLSAVTEMTLPAKAKCQEELVRLQKFANDNRMRGDIQMWDIAYWRRKERQSLYKLDPKETAAYFSFPEVWRRLQSLCQTLFGIQLERVPPTAAPLLWHGDVEFYRVVDEKGEQLGGLYLDVYARPGKQSGSYFVAQQNKSSAANALPLGSLLFSWPAPTASGPSLLTYEDLGVFCQKLGSALQHLLTRMPYADVAGLNNIEWDAVDVVGKFFRMLCQSPEVLQYLSHHHKTAVPIPTETIQRIHAAERHLASLDLLSEMYFSVVDLSLYSKVDFWEDIMKDTWRDFMPFPLQKGDAHLCSSPMLFIGNYAAGYYSHLWSEMVAADIIAAFREAGLNDKEKMMHIGRRFREAFLSLGGGAHAADVFARFQGRALSPKSLLTHLSIDA